MYNTKGDTSYCTIVNRLEWNTQTAPKICCESSSTEFELNLK